MAANNSSINEYLVILKNLFTMIHLLLYYDKYSDYAGSKVIQHISNNFEFISNMDCCPGGREGGGIVEAYRINCTGYAFNIPSKIPALAVVGHQYIFL